MMRYRTPSLRLGSATTQSPIDTNSTNNKHRKSAEYRLKAIFVTEAQTKLPKKMA
jgi:hypothetical protein